MRNYNNSNPAVCVNNLLQIARGEVPYDRVKGVGLALLDRPSTSAIDNIAEDAEWMLGVYEPRAEIEGVEVTPDDAAIGHFTLAATIKTIKEAEG